MLSAHLSKLLDLFWCPINGLSFSIATIPTTVIDFDIPDFQQIELLNTIHIIESTYRRALAGRESSSINSTQIYSQVDNISANRLGVQPKKKFNLLNKKTW